MDAGTEFALETEAEVALEGEADGFLGKELKVGFFTVAPEDDDGGVFLGIGGNLLIAEELGPALGLGLMGIRFLLPDVTGAVDCLMGTNGGMVFFNIGILGSAEMGFIPGDVGEGGGGFLTGAVGVSAFFSGSSTFSADL